MADINWTSTGAIIVYCVIGAAGIGYGIYKKNKGSDTTTRDSFDAVDNTGVDNRVNPTSGGKISRRNKSKKTNKTRNKKYKRS
jgi:hypothetical protein